MSQIELNDGLARHMVKPGDPGRNPTGKNGSPLFRMQRMEITKALLRELDEPCTVKGFEHLSWFRAGLLNLLRLYVEGVPWAVREVHNRAFGRVPLDIDIAQELRLVEPVTRIERVIVDVAKLPNTTLSLHRFPRESDSDLN